MPLSILFLCNPAMKSLALLEALPDDVNLTVTLDEAAVAAKAPGADVLVLNTDDQRLIGLAVSQGVRLKWIHSLMAGVEKKLTSEIRQSAVPLTNARGVYAESLGEFVLTACLYFAKDIRRLRRQQAEHRWEQFEMNVVAGKTMVILGYGEIGRASARRAHAMGMRVFGIRRRPELSAGDPYVEAVASFDERERWIKEADYLVVAAPNAPDTHGLVGSSELAAMKPTAVLINVGRGPVVTEAALVDALRHHRILGAALDVFDEEPLPPNHPFYDLDNVLLSPHCADMNPGWLDESVRFFLENFDRFRAGAALRNVVNKELGY